MPYFETVVTYKKSGTTKGPYGLYGRRTYTEIMILPLLTNIYEKISTVVVFNASRFFSREEHRSRSAVAMALL
jgi:hypothetical protein